jgi:hypothetical protein
MDGRPAGIIRRPAFPLNWLWLAVLSFVGERIVMHYVSRTDEAATLMPILLPAATLLLVPFLIKNLRYRGMWLILVGLALNLLVMLANGGLMPTDAAAVEAVGVHSVDDLRVGEPIPGTKNILMNRDEIRLRELSDAIILPFSRPFTRAISVGDLIIFPGVIVTFMEVIRCRRPSGLSHRTLLRDYTAS